MKWRLIAEMAQIMFGVHFSDKLHADYLRSESILLICIAHGDWFCWFGVDDFANNFCDGHIL